MSEHEPSGALSVGGRFQRMEEALLRIEAKLDAKADVVDVTRLEHRIMDLEAGTTPMGSLLLRQFEEGQRRLERLEREGSVQAQEAEALAHQLELKVQELERSQAERTALLRAERERAVTLYNARLLLVGAVSAAAAVAAILPSL